MIILVRFVWMVVISSGWNGSIMIEVSIKVLEFLLLFFNVDDMYC